MNTIAPVIPALPTPSFMSTSKPPVQVGPPKSFMLYGDTGTRKTLSLKELFKAGFFKRPFFINLDQGDEVLASDPVMREAFKSGQIHNEVIDPFDPQATARLETIILELAGMWRDPNGNILANPNVPDFGYDLIFIDTVNLMHEVALKHFQATTYNAAGTKLDGLAAYGKVAVWMDEMIRLIHNSTRFTGGFVMHAKTVEEKTGATKVKPKLSGSFKDSIATIPSIVAYLDYQKENATDAPVLTATVGESDLYDSKNRYNLPNKIPKFNLAEVYGTIYDQVGLPRPEPVATTTTPVPTAAPVAA